MNKSYKKFLMAGVIGCSVLYANAFATTTAPEVKSISSTQEAASSASRTQSVKNQASKNVKKKTSKKAKKKAVKKASKKSNKKSLKAKHKLTPAQLAKRKAHIQKLHEHNLKRHHAVHNKNKAQGHKADQHHKNKGHNDNRKVGQHKFSRQHHPDTHHALHKHLNKLAKTGKLGAKDRRAAHLILQHKLIRGAKLTPEEHALHTHLAQAQVAENSKSGSRLQGHLTGRVAPVSRAANKS